MAEDSRDVLRAQVRKLKANTDALKNSMPPHVAEMAAKLEEKFRYLPWGDIQEQRAELQAEAAEHNAPVATQSASKSTEPPDPERRLARLRTLGGTVKRKRGDWKFTGITKLVALEKSEGRKRSDEKTIRLDLHEALRNEDVAKCAGFGAGLGQR